MYIYLYIYIYIHIHIYTHIITLSLSRKQREHVHARERKRHVAGRQDHKGRTGRDTVGGGGRTLHLGSEPNLGRLMVVNSRISFEPASSSIHCLSLVTAQVHIQEGGWGSG